MSEGRPGHLWRLEQKQGGRVGVLQLRKVIPQLCDCWCHGQGQPDAGPKEGGVPQPAVGEAQVAPVSGEHEQQVCVRACVCACVRVCVCVCACACVLNVRDCCWACGC